MNRLQVAKTYKIYIDGQFPRTESGRHFQLLDKKAQLIANLCLCSKKDVRNAVSTARKAFPSWNSKPAFNRSQILYRLAEMLEGRRMQFAEELELQGLKMHDALQDVSRATDRLVYYAGWCDKYSQLFSSVNPVASSHFNFSMPEAMGVVNLLAGTEDTLDGMISMLAPALAGGNTCVYLASKKFPLSAVTFAEVLATSDVPAGVVNVITGDVDELSEPFSTHMDVNALVYGGDNVTLNKILQQNCSVNVKRYFNWNYTDKPATSEGPYRIMDLQEIKTTWHPIENIGQAGGSY